MGTPPNPDGKLGQDFINAHASEGHRWCMAVHIMFIDIHIVADLWVGLKLRCHKEMKNNVSISMASASQEDERSEWPAIETSGY